MKWNSLDVSISLVDALKAAEYRRRMTVEQKKHILAGTCMKELDAISEIYKAISAVRFCATNAPLGMGDILFDQCERLEVAITAIEQEEAASLAQEKRR